MGKKVKILGEDPILSNNFKFEKRSKARLIQKQKSEEEKASDLKKKKVMLEVESKVDRQIQQLTTNINLLEKTHRISKMKQQLFNQNSLGVQPTQKISAKLIQVALKNKKSDYSPYQFHFNLVPKPEELVKQKKTTRKQQIEEKTRLEIKDMFSAGNNQNRDQMAHQEEINIEVTTQIFNLTPNSKKEVELAVNGQILNASANFVANQQILCRDSLLEDAPLSTAESIIKGYFDYVFVENSEEAKIQSFRTIVVRHAIQHLESCLKDQKGRGFTNCKFLILTPFLGDAKAILDLIEPHFEGYEIVNKQKLETIEDQNDYFRIGIKIARKKQLLTYFSNFDHSQIIISSPVGLKSIIGSEGDAKRELSFISSVEILYIDRASVLLMQNWSHLTEILKNMNFMPKYESLKNSIDTIRDSFIELKGRIFRQSIVFSQYSFPELNALKAHHFHNVQGIATSKAFYIKPVSPSDIDKNFFKIEIKQPKNDLQMRFEYFKRKFWDDLHNKETMTKVVLFTNSYFEYIKLKAFLENVNASAQYICEHTPINKVQSKLARFNNGQHRILLTTERAYYFDVCQVKNFHHLYFYSLPRNAFIFNELIQSIELNKQGSNSIISIYTKFDILILQRIVGTIKAAEMVQEYCNNVSFVI